MLMRRPTLILIAILVCLTSGCGSVIKKKSQEFAHNLDIAIRQNDDLETVRRGAPSYLLLVDSLVAGSPKNAYYLTSGASLYSAYSVLAGNQPAYSKVLTEKAFGYAQQAICLQEKAWCDVGNIDFDVFQEMLKQRTVKDISWLYLLGTTWAAWIQVNSEDWLAVAQLQRVRVILQYVIALDEQYQAGEAHLYLAVLDTILPDSMGGRFAQGQQHFQKAIAYSDEQNLMAKLYYAKLYAKGTYDKALFEQLMREIQDTPTTNKQYNLSNALAREEANILITQVEEFF